MNKKLFLSTIALLVLSIMMISPVKAITKEPYEAHIEIDLIDSDKVWDADGIRQIKNSYWSGTVDGTLGPGIFEAWFKHLSLNLATGEGTFSGKWLLTFSEGTLAGSARGKITGYFLVSGTFAGALGTGDLEGVRKMGSLEALINPTFDHMVMEAEGTIIYPKDF